MILGRPLLATIHAEIDVFSKEISLEIGDDMVTFDMDKKIHNFMTHVGKVYMVNSIHNDESSTSSNKPSDKSPQFEKSNNLYHENNNDNYMQERSSKKATMIKPDTNTPSMHFCKPVKKNCNGILKKKNKGGGLSFPDFLLVRRYLTIRKRKRIKVQGNDPKRIAHRREGLKKYVKRLESNLKTRFSQQGNEIRGRASIICFINSMHGPIATSDTSPSLMLRSDFRTWILGLLDGR
ncbi:hypothetical protein Tco_1400796 [Tanacetum coccineum]